MSFSKTLVLFLCTAAFSLAAPNDSAKTQANAKAQASAQASAQNAAPAISQEEMLIFKALLQSPLFKDNFVQ